MRSKFKWIFTLLLALSLQFSFAQEKTVTGVVSDKSGPLPGANVVVKGTTRSAQTDFDGKYSIKAKAGEVLVISFTGYNDSTVSVGAASSYNVSLKEQSVKLEEVVIDGYRSTAKAKSSVAQTTILAKTIENRPNVSFVQSLQGQVPGLQISTSSGSPGTAKIESLIRGVNSINGSTEPLVVIDGVPSSQGVFRAINPNDIESVTVLKDAAATSIYGTRGAGGIIVVKTKTGKYDSKLTVKYSGSYGLQELQQNKYDIANSKETLFLERAVGSGLGSLNPATGLPFTDSEIAAFNINTNWRDYFFRKGTSSNHDISISGGSGKMTNFTSLGYFEQEGIVPTTDFKRFSIRSNFTGKSANEKFSYSTNIFGSFSKRHQLDQETRTDINANVLQNPLQGLLTSLPYIDPNVYVNGQQLSDDFGAPSFQIVPYMLMDYLNPGNIPSQFEETKLLVNASGSYKLTKDLTFTTTAGIDYAQEFRNFARAPWSYLAIIATPVGADFGGTEIMSSNRDFSFSLTNKLNYNHTFKEKHTIDVNFFTDYLKLHRQFFGRTQNGLDPRTWAFGAGTGYIPFNPATPNFYVPTVSHLAGGLDKITAGMFAYFSTFAYDYDNKFGVDATIRRDASYKFVDDNQWGTFWSVAGRVNLDNFKFLDNTIFDELKVRASYGTNGNQNIPGPAAAGQNPYYLGYNLVRDTNGQVVGGGYSNLPALGVGVIANGDVKWETTTQLDFGIDFSISKRFSGSIDVYRKQTDDLFDEINVSAITSLWSIDGNSGSLRNTGIEAILKYDVFKKGDFKLELNANGAYNRAVYMTTGSGEDEPNGNTIRSAGQLIDQYFVAPYIGVNNSGFVDANGDLQPADGNLLFLDINGNVTETISDADRRKSGKSPYPVYQGGFGFNASYKGFFVNTQFTYALKTYRFDFDLTNMSDPTAIGVFAVPRDFLNAWDATNNPTSNFPSLFADQGNLTMGDTFSDRWLRDASYVRLKTLTFGYNVPAKFLDKSSISSLRFYTAMENYVTWTKWRGFDPESSGASNQGGYPAPKAITFGVDIQF
ncbi:SusC/RagA family TonB-linked outer membrane protein [Flavobacterium wongokense]|uniref:SusC/RagA family TonB-linked outer membrane protein n=1 Tax=Flavobacterium wongokense TaxID=2910674 RepID=UPI001F396E83|nr:SusC/RagA family TonB-linked outer membrane protein [Flavobacterium sp. WG47]MCF6130845.1 SusC/RagA family TonB-linked outer membrane protein [Flavobacterium sp. WG47]